MNALPTELGLTIVEGPWRVGSEMRWRVEGSHGPGVLGQLLPELAHDVSLRRRYVRDVERLRALGETGVAAVRQIGPTPDPSDPLAEPPWRLRDDPPGETLEAWLTRRAPAPPDEAAAMVATLAERIQQLHAAGAVLRDLNPRLVVIGQDDRMWLTDVGLARVDVLSTRTAASLIVEGSPYCAPELLTRTIADQRADVYGLGAVLYRALVGHAPHDDAPSLLRPSGPAPRVRAQRPELPAGLDELVARCLAQDPAHRPGSAAEVAEALRGRSVLPALAPRMPCQSCGAALAVGQRLCTHCGKLAVQFTAVSDGPGHCVVLTKIDEKARSHEQLRTILGAVSQGPLPAMNFLVGDARMYSKAERERRTKLPARLVEGLSQQGAEKLNQRLRAAGLETKVRRDQSGTLRKLGRGERVGLGVAMAMGTALALGILIGMGSIAGIVLASLTMVATVGVVVAIARRRGKRTKAAAMVQLRPAPAALPASDPLVARLAALLRPDPPADIREQVGTLALAVQRLVDHRARNLAEASEIDAVTEPVAELVRLVEVQVQAIARIDGELAQLSEGTLVRALAAADARNDPPAARESMLQGLDRLRALEDARARRFHGLLEAARLARRSVELGLTVRDDVATHEGEIALALAALEQELGHEPALPSPTPPPAAALPTASGDGEGSTPPDQRLLSVP